jgi:hypothetical protein
MFSAIDLDQTTCTGYVGSGVQDSIAHYRDKGIIIPESAARYIDFFGLPDVLRIHEEIPGALAGVRKLAQMGGLGYFTVRKGSDMIAQQKVETATREWLIEKLFPMTSHVTFCKSMAEKLLKLSQQPLEPQEPLILIDDSWKKALGVLPLLAEHTHETAQAYRVLCERLTIVAFGAEPGDLPPDAPIHLVALPDWSGIDSVIRVFTQKEEIHGISSNP